MAESSRTNGGAGSKSTLSVYPAKAEAVADEVSTHDSDDGDGAGGGAGAGAPTAKAAGGLKKGDALGRYLVLEQLGAGAMGVVYAAYDPELDRKIAIKILRPQEGKGDRTRRQERLVREAKAMAKLSHPNVGAIYDVGVHGDQVFLAMEFLSGGTLRAWIDAKKRPWREIIKMFIEVGKGLAGAHAEGLIHRDFKPDNVLLDKNGVPKVVDFGLVRLTSAALDRTTSGSMDAASLEESVDDDAAALPVAQTALAALTRTGALTGTPAYMAPEQFLGKEIDARSDQFAFCIALYEALYGERPFAGETVIGIADAVTSELIRPAPKTTDIPSWVRRCLGRGLRKDPGQRFAGFNELLATLSNDPVARLRRRIVAVAVSATAIAGAIAVRHTLVAKQQEIDRQVAEHAQAGAQSLAEATARRDKAAALRDQALTAFDNYQETAGEELWAQRLALVKMAAAAYERGIKRLEAAAALATDRGLQERTADALVAYIRLDGLGAAERQAAMHELATYDSSRARTQNLTAPSLLKIDISPEPMMAELEAYDPTTFKITGAPRSLGPTPLALELPPGSYRLAFRGSATRTPFDYPVVLAPGEKLTASLRVPSREAVPEDFAFVPEGRFLFGSDDEEIRAIFLETTPLHEIKTGPFLVCRHETTIAEWIAFLDDLPPRQREQRRPKGRLDTTEGFIDVQRSPAGTWTLHLRGNNRTYEASQGEPIVYADRDRHASQDWSRFPVSGVSPEDAVEYAAWLNRSGRVPGARICTEREWERVARGADSRRFPHGQSLAPEDANFDLTYGRRNAAFGPDEVGSHPRSRSPFDVDDLVGNVWEITSSVLERNQFVGRGGSFYQPRPSLLAMNRNPLSLVTRDHTTGLRICADVRL
jgi:formylglycine-generating enzyme required for sulfatase activity/tRNA A-37 threonylcarbamoyl transferase component Bud32